jgi:acyl-CoA thioesterase II
MGDFEVDTRVEGEKGRYHAMLSPEWEAWGPNGGYIAAVALRAAGREAAIDRPASFAAHFIGVAKFAPVDLEVTPVQQGRRAESIHVVMRQDGRPILQAIMRTAAAGPGLEHDMAVMPEAPDPDSLLSWDELKPDEPAFFNFWNNIEGKPLWPERIDAEPQPYEPVYRQWYRFRPRATFDDPWVDAGRMLQLIETLAWPAAMQPHPGPDRGYSAPNLDVSAWFHRSACDSEWLFGDHHSPVAEGGLMGTNARIWSRDRRLLATGGAQLFCVPVSQFYK